MLTSTVENRFQKHDSEDLDILECKIVQRGLQMLNRPNERPA